MNCPKCGNEMLCACSNCAPKNAGKVVEVRLDGDALACGHCGHSGSSDYWLDVEWKEYEKHRARQTETPV